MLNLLFRICLLLAFLLCSACIGGPKVVPPEVTGEGTAGIGGSYRPTDSNDYANGTGGAGEMMDSGVLNPPTAGISGGTGGQGENIDAAEDSDAGSIDDDDAGSTHEP